MAEVKFDDPQNTNAILDFLNRESAEIDAVLYHSKFLAAEFGGTDLGDRFTYRIRVPQGGLVGLLRGSDIEPVIASVYPHRGLDLIASKRGIKHILGNTLLVRTVYDPMADPYTG